MLFNILWDYFDFSLHSFIFLINFNDNFLVFISELNIYFMELAVDSWKLLYKISFLGSQLVEPLIEFFLLHEDILIMQEQMLFLSTDIKSFWFRNNIIRSTFKFVITFHGNSMGQLLLKFGFSLSNFISNILVLLLGYFFDLFLLIDVQKSFALSKTWGSFIFSVIFLAHNFLLFFNDLIDFLKLCLNIRWKFLKLERAHQSVFLYSLHREFLILELIYKIFLKLFSS